MASSNLSIKILAQNSASQTIDGVAGSLGKLASAATAPVRALGGLMDGLGRIGLAGMGVKALADSVGGLASSMVAGNAEFERYETQFGVLLGSAAAAKGRLEELAEFGAKTPFELPDVVRADKILQAFGLHAEDTAKRFGFAGKDIRTIAGDVAAGTGAGFEEISTYIGKFASGATGEAIARFQELGIVTRAQLQDMGLQFKDSGQLISPLDESMAVLLKAMKGKFGGMMDAQSGTFEGMMSNLQDWIGQTKRRLTQPIFEVLKDKLAVVLQFLGSPQMEATLSFFADTLANGISQAIGTLGNLWSLAQPAIESLQSGFQQLSGFVSQFLGYFQEGNQYDLMGALFGPDIGPKIDEVTRGIKELVGTFVEFAQRVIPAIQMIMSGDLDLNEWLADWIGAFGDAYGRYLGALLDLLRAAVPRILAQLEEWGQAFIGWISPMIPPFLAEAQRLAQQLLAWIVSQAKPILEQLGDWAQAFVAWIVPMTTRFLAEWPGMLRRFLDWIERAAGPILRQLGDWAIQFVAWVAPLIPPLLMALAGVLAALIVFVVETGGVLAQRLLQWGWAFVEWVAPKVGPLLGELGKLLTNMIGWMANTAMPAIGQQVLRWARAFIDWIATDVLPNLPPALQSIWAVLGGWLNDRAEDIAAKGREWGGNLLNGFIDTIKNIQIPMPKIDIEYWQMDIPGLGVVNIPKLVLGVVWQALKDIGLASGTDFWRGGPAIVGEHGAELVNLPRGSQVIPAGPTQALLRGGSGGGIVWTGNVIVQGSVIAQRDLVTAVREELLRVGRRNVSALGEYA